CRGYVGGAALCSSGAVLLAEKNGSSRRRTSLPAYRLMKTSDEAVHHKLARAARLVWPPMPQDSDRVTLYERCLKKHTHVRRFLVARAIDSWEVREEHDFSVLTRVRRRAWRRVEVDMRLFEIRAAQLQREGWRALKSADRST